MSDVFDFPEFDAELLRIERAIAALPGAIIEQVFILLRQSRMGLPELRQRLPEVSGELRRSVKVRRVGPLGLQIGITADYAAFTRFRRPIAGARTSKQSLDRYVNSGPFLRLLRIAIHRAIQAVGLEPSQASIRLIG